MRRRKFFKYLAIGTATSALGSSLQSCVADNANKVTTEKVKWGYIGEGKPESWGELAPEFEVCQLGKAQSPINLEQGIDSELTEFTIDYQDTSLQIVNNGHTIQVNCTPGSFLNFEGQPFQLLQFHFHNPSEHQVKGKPFPMELHLVHQSETGALAVLGIFLQEGAKNPVLEKVWQKMPQEKNSEVTLNDLKINPAELLPQDQSHYRYYGSLTTPPCSEVVTWLVYQQPVEMSAAQIEQFAKIFPMNARPIQNLERRFILQS